MNHKDSGTEPQTIEVLRARYERLNARKVQAEKELAVAEANLRTAQKAVRETYGTDDLEELRAKLAQWTAENETMRREYEASLDEIESNLAAIKAEAPAA